MALKKFYKIPASGTWKGVDKSISERGDTSYLENCVNFDSNLVDGELVSRLGYDQITATATGDLAKAYAYRDEVWQKDVLLTYDRDSTAANRKIRLYTRNIDTTGDFTFVKELDYGSVNFADYIRFLQHRNTVRIGTGVTSLTKALFAGFVESSMFNNSDFDRNDFFTLKANWVQQADGFGRGGKIRHDTARGRYYMMTMRGLEIRDEDFTLIEVLNDCVLHEPTVGIAAGTMRGGIDMGTNNLFVCGRIPDSLDTIAINYALGLGESPTIVASLTKVDAASDHIHHIAVDSSNIFLVWDDGANGKVTKYSFGFLSPTDIYTGSRHVVGCTQTEDWVFTHDQNAGEIIASNKTPTTNHAFAHGVTISSGLGDMDAFGEDDLYWCEDVSVRHTDIGTPSSMTGTTIVNTVEISGQRADAVSIIGGQEGYVTARGYIGNVVNIATSFNVVDFLPGKIYLDINATEESLVYATGKYTLFYAVSVEDIYGQHSHMMHGPSLITNDSNITGGLYSVAVVFMALSEQFTERAGLIFDLDPASDPSVWDEYRRIKKIHVWRAFSPEADAGNPATNYRIHSTIDIDAPQWFPFALSGTEYRYASFSIREGTLETEMSSVTFEQFTGLQEIFKPYYTNWMAATEQAGHFYFGNVFTDAAYPQQIIQSAANAPDMNYQLPTNIAVFGYGDGDKIQGLGKAWNRVFVTKKRKSAFYNGINQETVIDIGCQSPDSIVSFNNIIFLQGEGGFYKITPSGYQRVSIAVDALLTGETFGNVSATLFESKRKIWFLFPSSKSYMFNYDIGTWDIYDINNASASLTQNFIFPGLNSKPWSCSDSEGHVYQQDTTNADDGNEHELIFLTKNIVFGQEFFQEEIDQILLTYFSPVSFVLTAYVDNENGTSANSLLSIPAQSLMISERRFVRQYGQAFRMDMNNVVDLSSGQMRIKSFAVIANATETEVDAE